jgi:hypothetical protein
VKAVAESNGNVWRQGLRRLIVVTLLILFAISNIAVQSHVHGSAAAFHKNGPSASNPSNPADNDTQSCPLCQEFLAGGSFVLPGAILVVLPALVGSIEMPVLVQRIGHPAAHDWRGRAPPAL